MHRLPPPLDTLLAEAPGYVLAALAAAPAALLAIVLKVTERAIAQFPDPIAAGQWSERGYLIVAIIVLFGSLVTVVGWVATKALKTFQDITAALTRLTESVEKQNDYFDEIAKQAVRSALTAPPNGLPYQ